MPIRLLLELRLLLLLLFTASAAAGIVFGPAGIALVFLLLVLLPPDAAITPTSAFAAVFSVPFASAVGAAAATASKLPVIASPVCAKFRRPTKRERRTFIVFSG